MEQRINDLCEALSQFYLGIVPMAAGIHDDLKAMYEAGQTLRLSDSTLTTLDEVKELDIQLGINLHEIRHLIRNYVQERAVAVEERKVKTPPTAEDALKALQGLSAEDIGKLLRGLK